MVEAEAEKHLARRRLEFRGVKFVQSLSNGVKALVFEPALVLDAIAKSLEPRDLFRDVVDDRLHGGALRGIRFLVQVVEVDVLGDGHLAQRDGSEHVRLAAPVVSDDAVAPADGELERAVRNELLPRHRHREGVDLDVLGGAVGGQDAGHGPALGVRQLPLPARAILVDLQVRDADPGNVRGHLGAVVLAPLLGGLLGGTLGLEGGALGRLLFLLARE
mmetsp:Transcript_47417/g.151875  ORF Transcript_47417/g.151875 Transcript_47417/m.151875 type:complete len:218 (-) Transcript_47417:63-716(-)